MPRPFSFLSLASLLVTAGARLGSREFGSDFSLAPLSPSVSALSSAQPEPSSSSAAYAPLSHDEASPSSSSVSYQESHADNASAPYPLAALEGSSSSLTVNQHLLLCFKTDGFILARTYLDEDTISFDIKDYIAKSISQAGLPVTIPDQCNAAVLRFGWYQLCPGSGTNVRILLEDLIDQRPPLLDKLAAAISAACTAYDSDKKGILAAEIVGGTLGPILLVLCIFVLRCQINLAKIRAAEAAAAQALLPAVAVVAPAPRNPFRNYGTAGGVLGLFRRADLPIPVAAPLPLPDFIGVLDQARPLSINAHPAVVAPRRLPREDDADNAELLRLAGMGAR